MCDSEYPSVEYERSFNHNEIRQLYLPLENVKKCSKCGKQGDRFSICSRCGESAYCGRECQKEDWPNHKAKCGKTDRISLSAFYPLIAVLMESQRVYPQKPVHPALSHKIVNSPNPNSEGVCKFPDGSSARLILLGEEISQEHLATHPREWWPTAITDPVRYKLVRRFCSEHFLLPGIVATLVALMAEMYTTTHVSSTDSPDGTPKHRIRLKYHNSPIADFGIAKGWADVKAQDKFAYFNVADGTFTKGQDSNDHYWIYFTTAAGEDFILDCGMFTFNFCMLVNTAAHTKYGFPPRFTLVPAYFRDRPYKHNAPNLQYEKQRFSVLRDVKLRDAIQYSRRYFRGEDAKVICEFMEKVAGRSCSQVEKNLVMTWCVDACEVMWRNFVTREYLNYPEEPSIAIQSDPGEMDETPEENEAWWKYMKKWNRKHRKGEITSEQLGEAFRAWDNKPHDERHGLTRRSDTMKTRRV